jgi:signal transduction histidine kinase
MSEPHTKAGTEQAERLHRFAHDIRNRLAGMRQVLQHLASPDPEMDAAELALFGEQQFFKALREVESLLDDLSVERGVGAIRPGTVDLAAVVGEAIADLDHRYERKEQGIEKHLPETLLVAGDAHLLKELVAALLSNASKFSPAKEVVHVSLTTADGQAEFTVRDHGVGLSANDLANVFVRYAWLESRPTAGEAQGRSTLARARQWAEAHGGTLSASSAGPGEGCSFTLRLPLAGQ